MKIKGLKLSKKIIEILTFIIYILAIISFEIGYCNASNVTELINGNFSNINYNFSLCRIVMYIAFIIIFFLVKNKFSEESEKVAENKYKKIFIYLYLLLAIITICISIIIIIKNPLLTRGITIGIIAVLMSGVFIINISNNAIKNIIIILFSLGLVFTITTDYNHAIDEKKHFMSAFNIAFGNFDYVNNPITDVEINKLPHFYKFVWIDESLNEKYMPNITDEVDINDMPSIPATNNFITYLFPALGIFIAKTLGGSIIDLYIMGRLFNLILYCILLCIAVKLIPYKKNIFATVALMPIAILLSASFSIDGFCIAVLYVFIAYCLKLKKEKETITLKDFAILIVLFVLTLLAKSMAYILIAMLVLMLPIKNTLKKNKKYLPVIITATVICIILICCLLLYVKNTKVVEDSRAGDNVSVSAQLDNLIHNPIFDVKLVLEHFKNTLLNFNWHIELHNTAFFTVNAQCVFIPMILFILYVALTEDDFNFEIKDKILMVTTFLLVFLMTSMVLYVAFTKVGELHIDGYQTRYILPILPLVLFGLSNNKLICNNGENRNMNISIISGIFIFLSLLQCIIS